MLILFISKQSTQQNLNVTQRVSEIVWFVIIYITKRGMIPNIILSFFKLVDVPRLIKDCVTQKLHNSKIATSVSE